MIKRVAAIRYGQYDGGHGDEREDSDDDDDGGGG
eukprot:CAMPEP_0198343672 /NCGR_PEP_ID=MMETSP1450-20131203/61913_1 /TAXON_ID=753684 ORGANISM="Madagascaria erythrocladiodes, Strain CCMP3234" /NCGR_SAMPLE_ID=MMETSP1450 /ASSEMBLY_ACC=CAM_ASM_001115 /LENGTH=33 /DNA_ID= /DNA_START= /DNA_END= /DNA_ORIENTATION=